MPKLRHILLTILSAILATGLAAFLVMYFSASERTPKSDEISSIYDELMEKYHASNSDFPPFFESTELQKVDSLAFKASWLSLAQSEVKNWYWLWLGWCFGAFGYLGSVQLTKRHFDAPKKE